MLSLFKIYSIMQMNRTNKQRLMDMDNGLVVTGGKKGKVDRVKVGIAGIYFLIKGLI